MPPAASAPMGKLSYDEFKFEMRSSLRDRGVVDSLKAQVRASLVQELQAKSVGGALAAKPAVGLAQQAVNALIADFLRSSSMPYTLSVFGPESGGGLGSDRGGGGATPRPDILTGLGLGNVGAPTPDDSSLLEALIGHMRATLNKATAVCEVQTDPPRSPEDAVDVEARLRDLDERFLRQSEAERGNPARGVEERMEAYQRECDERARTEIEAEVERMKETEISRARSEERAHFAAELSTRLDELEKEHSDRLTRQRRREQDVMTRLAEKERTLEAESHAQRQRMLEDLDRVSQKQADLDRQKAQHDRQCESDRQRATERERELTHEAARLRSGGGDGWGNDTAAVPSGPTITLPEPAPEVERPAMPSPNSSGLPPTPNPDQVSKLERRVSELLDSEEQLQDELEQLRERNQALEEQMASQSEGEEGAMAMLSLRQELAKAHHDVSSLEEQVAEANQHRVAADARAAAAESMSESMAAAASATVGTAGTAGTGGSAGLAVIQAELSAEIRERERCLQELEEAQLENRSLSRKVDNLTRLLGEANETLKAEVESKSASAADVAMALSMQQPVERHGRSTVAATAAPSMGLGEATTLEVLKDEILNALKGLKQQQQQPQQQHQQQMQMQMPMQMPGYQQPHQQQQQPQQYMAQPQYAQTPQQQQIMPAPQPLPQVPVQESAAATSARAAAEAADAQAKAAVAVVAEAAAARAAVEAEADAEAVRAQAQADAGGKAEADVAAAAVAATAAAQLKREQDAAEQAQAELEQLAAAKAAADAKTAADAKAAADAQAAAAAGAQAAAAAAAAQAAQAAQEVERNAAAEAAKAAADAAEAATAAEAAAAAKAAEEVKAAEEAKVAADAAQAKLKLAPVPAPAPTREPEPEPEAAAANSDVMSFNVSSASSGMASLAGLPGVESPSASSGNRSLSGAGRGLGVLANSPDFSNQPVPSPVRSPPPAPRGVDKDQAIMERMFMFGASPAPPSRHSGMLQTSKREKAYMMPSLGG